MFEPASGSVTENASAVSPVAIRGSHSRFCSSLPWRTRNSPQIAVETISRNDGVPAAASSSQTIASSAIPPSAPPYSDGMLTPRKP